MLLLLACVTTKPVESSPVQVDSQTDSPVDSPVDSPKDSPTDSPEDSPEDSPVESPPPDSDTSPPAPEPWRSQLYPSDWTPDYTAAGGHFLHDFSYAGYHRSEVALPTPPGPSFDVLSYGADASGQTDSTTAIQAAIDAASTAGGVVSLPAGTFKVDGQLRVQSSGVVIKGAGNSSTFMYFTQIDGMDYGAHLSFQGSLSQSTEYLLSSDGLSRSTVVYVTDASGLAAGDEVSVGQLISDDFVADHGMTGIWVEFNGEWRAFFRRTVVSVDTTVSPNAITLDIPLRYPLLTRDSASLRKESGYLTECGIEDIALADAENYITAWTHSQINLLSFSEVSDCWVQRLASWASPQSDPAGYHILNNGLLISDSKRVTVSDSNLGYAQNRGSGGNGYLFEIRRSNEILTQDSIATAGRHNFIQNWDFGTSGCVWLRTESYDGRSMLADWDSFGYDSYSEFHHSLAMANLIDQSIASDGWQGVNRQTESSGAGHSVTESVFWNLSGGGYLRSLQYGDGYIIGTTDMDVHTDPTELDWYNSGGGTEPADWLEGEDAGGTLEPTSLFEDQHFKRLGF